MCSDDIVCCMARILTYKQECIYLPWDNEHGCHWQTFIQFTGESNV